MFKIPSIGCKQQIFSCLPNRQVCTALKSLAVPSPPSPPEADTLGRQVRLPFFLFAFFLFSFSCQQGSDSAEWSQIGNEIQQIKEENLLNTWYPKCIDTVGGGYLSNLSKSFYPLPDQDKMIVTQARHLWTTSQVAQSKGDQKYLKYAMHGFSFLQKMWDPIYGGFFQNVDRYGIPLDSNEHKTAYGNAFGIYGLSAFYTASGDTSALDLARGTFQWLEDHSHDPIHSGYFQVLSREGNVIPAGSSTTAFSPAGYKDQNSSIHLLEAFTTLYQIWPDSLVKERLIEMFYLVKDVMVNELNHLDLFFTHDWEPVSFYGQDRSIILENVRWDHVSFGHDIETAFLLLEAAETMNIGDKNLLNELKEIVDHTLAGWDQERGGLYDQGYYFNREESVVIIKDSKEWWAQAEALNTFLIFHSHFPGSGYDLYFEKQWEYIKTYLIDPENGGWYTYGLDSRPDAIDLPKSTIWKSTYHNYRALANCISLLE